MYSSMCISYVKCRRNAYFYAEDPAIKKYIYDSAAAEWRTSVEALADIPIPTARGIEYFPDDMLLDIVGYVPKMQM
jgi:hypothetical protein